MDSQITIPTGQFLTLLLGMLVFLLTHLFAAIWFASKMNTRVTAIAKALDNLEQDMKTLIRFDAKIEVLHERMNQSQEDRRMLWTEIRKVEEKAVR